MNLSSRMSRFIVIAVAAVAFTGCATHDRKSTNTMLGAGLGAAAGAVVSQGNPLLTVGGAAAGGLLGNILTEDKKDRRSRGWNSGGGRSHHVHERPRHRHDRHPRRHR